MSVTYTYPGIYVQELPLSAHTITPAPTSITAFVGYTHPWKTQNFNTAVQLFSFSDYETYFGGLYASGDISSDVARAVNEFFNNGGTNAYVVGLQPNAYDGSDPPNALGTFGLPPNGTIYATASIPTDSAANGLQFTALEPTDVVTMMVRVMNIRQSLPAGPYDTFDIVISYGTRIETYRGVGIGFSSGRPVMTALAASTLVTVAVQPGGTLGTHFPPAAGAAPAPITQTFTMNTPATFATSFSASDFIAAFQANQSLDQVEIFNLLLVPGVADNLVLSAGLSFAERKRAFMILDPPENAPAFGSGSIDTLMGVTIPESPNGAIYFPYLKSTDPITTNSIAMPPGGYVAGVFAATDTTRGVWKAPAGLATTLLDTTGPVPSGVVNDMQQGVLNMASVNCIRTFTGSGTVVYGSRTLVAADEAYAQYVYVPVRRTMLFIEQTLVANLKWVVFEPNDEPLWLAICSSINAFLLSLFNQQALQGATPSDAFAVKCDATTTTAANQAAGIVNIIVGVALLKPAEFVVIKLAQLAGQTAS